MKFLLHTLLLLALCVNHSFAQDFSKVDIQALTLQKDNYITPEALSKALTKGLATDVEKYRALFTWLGHNIRYDTKKLKKIQDGDYKKSRVEGSSIEEIRKKSTALYDKAILKTYRSGKGVCEDYSRLYQKMCEASGLKCALIVGKSRQITGNLGSGHAWNAIWANDAWHLVDCTWGAGGREEENEQFKFDFKPGYFMTPPKLFVLDHFPEESKWQLLAQPYSEKELNKQPHLNYANATHPFSDFAFQASTDGKSTEIKFKFSAAKPSAIMLSNANAKPIEFRQDEQDGFVILTFKRMASGKAEVFVSSTAKQGKMLKIASFELGR